MRSISGIIAAVLATLLFEEAVAGPQHGHLHKKKKTLVVDVVTDIDVIYETVTDIVWVPMTDESGAITTSTAPVVAAVVTTTSSSVTVASAAVTSISAAAAAPPLPSSVVVPISTTDTKGIAPPAPVESSSTVVAAYTAPVIVSSIPVAPVSSSVSLVAASTPTTLTTSGSTTTPTGSGSKRGLSYNEASLLDLFTGSNSIITWCYNWGSASDGSIPSSFEYVPMLWRNTPACTVPWSTNAQAAIDEGSKHLLAFNEPNNSGQANMSIADSVAGYLEYMNPFAGKAQLGAPAVDNSGLDYLREFIAACSECHIDFVPIHWYDSATNYVYFKEYIQEAYVAGGNRTLWITEFGASGSTEEQITFLEVVMPWLDEQDYVERYSYYMDKVGSLLETESELSSIGTAFLDYTSNTISGSIGDV